MTLEYAGTPLRRRMLVTLAMAALGACGDEGSTGPDSGPDFLVPKVDSPFILMGDAGVMTEYTHNLGCNAVQVGMRGWREVEPIRGQLQFDGDLYAGDTQYRGHLITTYGFFEAFFDRRLAESRLTPWMAEMLFGQSTVPDDYHEGVHVDLPEEFLDAYVHFFEQSLADASSQGVDLSLVVLDLEPNVMVDQHHTGYGVTRAVALLKRLAEIIPRHYPDAHVGVNLATQERAPWYVEPQTDLDAHGAADFAERMIEMGVGFDTIGFRWTPDIYESGPSSDYEDFVEDLAKLGKWLYVWGAWFAADPAFTMAEFPHTEETQRQEILDFMRVNLDHPQVIGVNIQLFDYVEETAEGPVPFAVGLVAANHEQMHEPGLRLRPAYTALQDYWLANHPAW